MIRVSLFQLKKNAYLWHLLILSLLRQHFISQDEGSLYYGGQNHQ